MAYSNPIQYVTVAQSATISGDIDLKGAKSIALWAPTVTSCQAYLQVNVDTTSANFVRVYDPTLVGSQWMWSVGVGSAAIPLSEGIETFSNARVEFDIAQSDVRTLQILTKP